MIKLSDLLGKCPPHHLEAIARQVGSGISQKGGFLCSLVASIGIPMAIDLVKKLIGAGVHVSPPPVSKGQGHSQGYGKGIQINPPPFYGTWLERRGAGTGKKGRKKRPKFIDVPLSNLDLENWCKYLEVPIKGIFSRNQKMMTSHSPCIINMDDYGSQGTHWLCCNYDKDRKTFEYFDSFGLPPPDEWDKNISHKGFKNFEKNDNQIQNINSVRCGYYCLLFLNERTRGRRFKDILGMFTKNTEHNEKLVKRYIQGV